MAFGIPQNFNENINNGFEEFEAEKPIIDDTTPPEDTPPEDTPPIIKEDIPTPPIVKEDKVEPTELSEEQVKAYLSKRAGKEFKTLEEAYTPQVKEVEKLTDPWEGVMDDDDRAYMKFKKDTKLGRKEFDFVNQDLSKVSPLELSIKRIRQETGLDISDSEARNYLEAELGIDLEAEEISINDRIKLSTYSKPYKESIEQQKEKYLKPFENKAEIKNETSLEKIKLEDGREIPKAEYDAYIRDRETYIKNITDGVNSVAKSDFSIEIDDNGEKRKVDFSYEYSKEDKHSMLSEASDIDATIEKRYGTGKNFNHSQLAEGLWWGVEKNRTRVISAAMEKVRAETIEEMLADSNNENFSRKSLQKSKTNNDGYGELTGTQDTNGYGVKFNFEKSK